MRLRTLGKFCVTGLFVSVLAACGGSNSSTSPSPESPSPQTPTPEAPNTISILGSDGPMAGADVAVYDLQAYIDPVIEAENLLVAPATTDIDTALADNLELALNAGDGPFMVIVTAKIDGSSRDLSTGAAPVITEVKTIVTQAAYAVSGARFYATPLTTAAVAIASKDKVIAADVVASLDAAQLSAIRIFGFGLGEDVDIFSIPPVLDETTVSVESQQTVAQYRGASETLAAIVEDNNVDFDALIGDVADGVLNDVVIVGAIENLVLGDVLSRVGDVASIAALLDSDSTGLASYDIAASVDATPDFVVDADADGQANDIFPYDPLESVDTDGDDIGNNADIDDDNDMVPDVNDAFPLNDSESVDTDGDEIGNNADTDDDNDLQTDADEISCGSDPLVASSLSTDTDNDSSPDCVDTDDDNDTVLDVNDAFPLNNSESVDTDGDEIGNNSDPDIDGDTLANADDPDPLNSESKYHFDFFYNQLSSATEAFKAAVVGETVTQSDGTIDIGLNLDVDITSLDLGSDELGIGSFKVLADYATTEESLSSTGATFSPASAVLTEQPVTAGTIVNQVALANGVLSFNGEASPALAAWGKYNFIGSGRVTLGDVSTTLEAAAEQALSVLSFADGSSADSDLNADYGMVALDIIYGDDSADDEPSTFVDLVRLTSSVGVFTFDGDGLLATANGSEFGSSLGLTAGMVEYSTELPAETGTYTVSLSGAVELVFSGDPDSIYGFADSAGELITLGDPASRLYGVKLGSVAQSDLAGKSYDLQGIVIDSSNVTLNASTYVGGVATFGVGGTTLILSGDITKAVAAFSASALPSVTTTTESLSGQNLTSDTFTVADNGRLSPITFANSGLELEGFIAENGGLLLRVVNMETVVPDIEDLAGLQVGETLYPLANAPFDGVTPQVCDIPCTDSRDIAEGESLGFVTAAGDIVIGTWSNGSSVATSITADVRESLAPILDPIAVDTTVNITQGVLFGIPN